MHASIKCTRIISGGASTKPRWRFSESQSGDPVIVANSNVRERGLIGPPIAVLWTDDFSIISRDAISRESCRSHTWLFCLVANCPQANGLESHFTIHTARSCRELPSSVSSQEERKFTLDKHLNCNPIIRKWNLI